MQSCLFAETMSLIIERNKQQTVYLHPLSKQVLSEILLLYHLIFSGPDYHPSITLSIIFCCVFCLLHTMTVRASPKVIKSLLLCAVYYTEKKNIFFLYKLFCLCVDSSKPLGFQFSRALNLCSTQFLVH